MNNFQLDDRFFAVAPHSIRHGNRKNYFRFKDPGSLLHSFHRNWMRKKRKQIGEDLLFIVSRAGPMIGQSEGAALGRRYREEREKSEPCSLHLHHWKMLMHQIIQLSFLRRKEGAPSCFFYSSGSEIMRTGPSL